MERPKLDPRNQQYLEAFNDLSRSRVVSQGDYQPVQQHEIASYMVLEGLDPREGPKLRRMVQAMDWVYLDSVAKKKAKANK